MKMAMLLKQMEVNSEQMLTKTQTEVLIISSLVTKEFINAKKTNSKVRAKCVGRTLIY